MPVRDMTISGRGLVPGPDLARAGGSQFRIVLAGAAAAAGFGVVTRQATHGRLGQLDEAVMTRVLVMRRPAAAVTAALTLSALAEPATVAAALAVSGLTGRADWRTRALACLTVGSGAAARHLVAGVVARPRPPRAGWLVRPSGFSLPSRHTTLAMLTAYGCTRCAGVSGPADRLLPPAAAVAVGASRIYLGVHWPGDVLAAVLFATTWLTMAEAAAQICRRPR
jgi:undecaprenyl-diphosphatase